MSDEGVSWLHCCTYTPAANPSVIIRSRAQHVLRGDTTTLEARVFASPNNATIMWYYQGTLIDIANDPRYTASSSGDMYSLTVSSVSEAKVGEYTIVVSLNGMTANDTIMLAFPGMFKFFLYPL